MYSLYFRHNTELFMLSLFDILLNFQLLTYDISFFRSHGLVNLAKSMMEERSDVSMGMQSLFFN